MSLDVSLETDKTERKCFCPDCGHEHTKIVCDVLFSANITHNLGRMAEEAGIYKHLWLPEKVSITKAHELVEPLSKGLSLMKSDPERFKKFNAKNGWGVYEHFIPWIEEYIDACVSHPNANVSASI